MGNVEKKLNDLKVLHGWGGIDVLSNVDEKLEDIWMLIEYLDHGDEYLIVGTRDGKLYEYGCFSNLKDDWRFSYERIPVMNKTIDADTSNEIFRRVHFDFSNGFSDFNKKYSMSTAQITFDSFIEYMEYKRVNGRSLYDFEHYKWSFEKWLKLNEINTEENLNKLKTAIFHNKDEKYRTNGIAGKIDITDWGDIFIDELICAIVNDKVLNKDAVAYYDHTDEWGDERYRISLKDFCQFKARA